MVTAACTEYLIHHVLAERGFNPPGVVFPVSAVMFDRIADYKAVLESYSSRMLPLVAWEPTQKNNVRVLNDTLDFYRYFDATAHVEFLFECVARTIDLLFRFLQQNGGSLSKRARENEFAALRPEEVRALENSYRRLFEDAPLTQASS